MIPQGPLVQSRRASRRRLPKRRGRVRAPLVLPRGSLGVASSSAYLKRRIVYSALFLDSHGSMPMSSTTAAPAAIREPAVTGPENRPPMSVFRLPGG